MNLAQNGNSYRNITTSTTTVVFASTVVLNTVTVNTKGTVASAVVIYDNTAASGTKIATIDSLNHAGTYIFEAVCLTGLTIVTTGAPDITVTYRVP
jgi:hypothetical protein